MCGIAGYFGSRTIDPGQIQTCLDLMRRRGPDHASYRHWRGPTGKNAYLLHSRLKIIDLDDRANQPFNVGSQWIVTNGELYNYVELRRELLSQGVPFRTTSDTEVLLQAIHTRGWEVLDQCEGMWAFAVYDEAQGSLRLCRDRFGEKPLYLYRDSKGLAFGSEIKFIVSLIGHRLPLDTDHLLRYMVNGYKSLYKEGHTFFQGLKELPPGSLLSLEPDGRETQRSYWQPSFFPHEAMSYPEAVQGVRERLIHAVDLRLRSDVPLAFCLSGGVDSNALIGIAKSSLGREVHGFTIVGRDARYDEEELVDEAVADLGIRHTAIPIETGGFLARLTTLIHQHDAPVYTITYYLHWLLMESMARQGYRISISGTAADELFTGYYDHHLAYLYQVRQEPLLYAASKQAWRDQIQPNVRNPYLGDPDAFMDNPGFRDYLYLDADRFAEYLKVDWSEPFTERKFTEDLLRNRMLNELFHETIPVILHEDDLNAMYFSMENRSPYLDRDLFEFCFQIPTRHLIQNGLAKALLRDAAQGLVPQRILDNPRKVGFNAPILSLLDVDQPEVRSALLDASPIFEWVRREKIEELMGKRDLPNSESKFLFYFLNSKIFLEQFST